MVVHEIICFYSELSFVKIRGIGISYIKKKGNSMNKVVSNTGSLRINEHNLTPRDQLVISAT